ncbi:plasmid mobilization protein [Adlercreutzia equolifaciens]|uniref:plasmid mobilization protein n=1 Tax=Adlercreutzia equolifaciens TaxID=446660 RepID=UPI003C6CB28D
MERHPKQIHVRMSEDEVARAKALARSLGMTLSDLIRTLLQMPTSSVGEGGNLIVIDRVTALKLAREMRRWGHHYNQAVHALNAIAYYLRTNDMDASDVLEELDRTSGKLAAMQPGIEELRCEVEGISQRAIAGIGR